jgi:hypothetical protein
VPALLVVEDLDVIEELLLRFGSRRVPLAPSSNLSVENQLSIAALS